MKWQGSRLIYSGAGRFGQKKNKVYVHLFHMNRVINPLKTFRKLSFTFHVFMYRFTLKKSHAGKNQNQRKTVHEIG